MNLVKKCKFEIRKTLKMPLKIAIVSYFYPPIAKDNGVAIHAFYLSKELAKMGCEVHVFTRGEKDSKRTEYLEEGKLVVHNISIKIKNPPKDKIVMRRMGYLLFDNLVVNGITKENTKDKFDIIHSHGWLTAGTFIAKYFNDIKWVHTFHSLEKNRLSFLGQEEKKYFNIVQWIESTINNADALISVSEKLKEETIKAYNARKEKFYTIPNGVDLDLFKPREGTNKEKRIVYMGRFSLEKGINHIPGIIEGALSKNKNIIFEILAPYNPQLPAIEKTKEKLEKLEKKYPKNIIWHKERKSREELFEMIRRSTICIQPSKYEAFGMTVLESMACGVVPIVSDRGGLPEVVGNAGIVVPLKEKSFVEEISRMIENYRLC
jgi:glycosyltransferase involved in cell wall biosynthesis